MTTKQAPEMVAEMAKQPTLDTYFDNNPASVTDDQLRELIELERGKRAIFIQQDAEK